MKIGILGGAFNPPHLGHQLICRQTLDFTKLEQIWLAPCYKHTFNKQMAPAEQRALMTRIFCRQIKVRPLSDIKYCGEEIENRLSGETIKLINLLKNKYLNHQFSFIIGSDNLKNFKKWGQWQKLASDFDIYVFPRPGFSFNLAEFGLAEKKYRFKLIKNRLLIHSNISSSNLRQRIKSGLFWSNLTTQNIQQYIIKHQLYDVKALPLH